MRKLVRAIIVICSISFGFLNAQITITSSSMPSSGDTLRYSSASPLTIGTTWMTPGGSQSWDFSSLTSIGQGLYEYKSANKTPYAFYFIGQIGQKTADSLGGGPFVFKNIYSFYTKSSSVFKTEGLGYSYSGIPLASKYTDDDEIYQNMRWLFQRAEGEELEEEEEELDDDDELDEEEVRDVPINYIVDNLRGLNYNFEDIVKVLVNDFLFKDQDERSINILDALEGLIERYDETTTEVVPVAPVTTIVTTIEEKKGSQIGWCLRHRMTADLCGNN